MPERDDDSGNASTLEQRDSFEAVLKKVVAEPPLLAPDTIVGGRFRIERVVGAGGMGTVYVARDQKLSRDVAIKLHHAARGGERLEREAIAMAQLAHPNVVTVFETGELDGRPFVVMEYVAGTTLRAWARQAPRTVRELIAALIAAGEGLAAAHDAGLVHRDFKPENVLIGADGRPRVGDFGLAKGTDEALESEVRGAKSDVLLTRTGVVLGTPAYMAPEQFAGKAVDARADQFAYCITAWEILWGERPFAGATFSELEAAIVAGKRRAAPSRPRVPAVVRAALERGLAIDPSQRFADMHALLATLRAGIARTRRRWIAAAAAVVVVAGGTIAFAVHGSRENECARFGHEQATATALISRLRATGHAEIADRVASTLAAYQRDYAQLGKRACTQDWPHELVERAATCLDLDVRATRFVMSADGVTDANLTARANRMLSLPSLEGCVDPRYLTTMRALPSDPAQLDAEIAARADLYAARFDIVDLRFDSAAQALARLTTSSVKDDPSIAAGIVAVRGELALHEGKTETGKQQLADAYYAARAADDDTIAHFALMRLLELESIAGMDANNASTWQRTALADAQRIETRAPWLATELYVALARLADAAGDADGALRFVAKARELVKPGGLGDLNLLTTEAAVKMWTGHVDEGDALYKRALALAGKLFSPEDSTVGSILTDYAAGLLAAGRAEPALEAAERADAILAKTGVAGVERDGARVSLAAVLLQAERDDEAEPLLRTARADYVTAYGENSPLVANVDSNLAIVAADRGDLAGALASSEHVLAIYDKVYAKDQPEIADAAFNVAANRLKVHDATGALAVALRARDIYAAKMPGSDRHRNCLTLAARAANDLGDTKQALALAEASLAFDKPAEDPQIDAHGQLEEARALVALGRKTEARPLLVTARATFDKVGSKEYVQRIDELLR